MVLHFTAGFSADSAITFWKSNKNGVSTPYIIDLDGTVYQTYDPRYWSYHLGIPKVSHDNDKRAIAIEIVNIGPLRLKEGKLYCWPNNFGRVFCDESETGKYINSSYRGFDYYARFTDAQAVAIPELVSRTCDAFSIARAIPGDDKRTACEVSWFSNYRGIASHQNFRADKFDIGPAFDWSILEGM